MDKLVDKQEKRSAVKKCCLVLLVFSVVCLVHASVFGGPKAFMKYRGRFQNSLRGNVKGQYLQSVGIEKLEKNVTKRLAERADRLHHTCITLSKRVNKDKEMLQHSVLYQQHYSKQQRVIIDKKLRLAVCLQAKGGSSFWKSLFLHREAHDNNTIEFMLERRSSPLLRFVPLSSYQKSYTSLKDDKYTMFVFGRNPWNRLVSLYRQKIEGRNETEAAYKYVKMACLGHPCDTFLEMLLCVLYTWEKGFPDRHWEPLTTRCDICGIPYTYFGRVENMNEEITEIFTKAGVKGDIASFLESARNFTIREVEVQATHVDYQDYYKNIPQRVIERIGDMYNSDIELLGYPDHPL